MLRNLFRRAAVADLDKVTYVMGATGIEHWADGGGADGEQYFLKKDPRTDQWNLVHEFWATNREPVYTTVSTVPKLEDGAVILRGVMEQELESHYGGFRNAFDGREYHVNNDENRQVASLAAVEQALELRR